MTLVVHAAAELGPDPAPDGPVRIHPSPLAGRLLVAALEGGEVDAALVPASFAWDAAGRALVLAAVLPRQEPRDVLIPAGSEQATLLSLPSGAVVALAGRYRSELLRVHRPDLVVVDCANGRTPSDALAAGEVDAAILGAAEARREGIAERATEILDPKAWVPTPGQGGRVILVRRDAQEVGRALRGLDDFRSRVVLEAERALGDILGIGLGGPLGALGLPYGRWMRLWAMVPAAEGRRLVRCDVSGNDTAPEEVARAAAELLVARGARELAA